MPAKIEFFYWIDFVVVAAQDDDAPVSPTSTDASPRRSGKVRNDIIGIPAVANLSTRRRSGVLCGHGPADRGGDICLYVFVAHLERLLRLWHAVSMDGLDRTSSNASRNSVS